MEVALISYIIALRAHCYIIVRQKILKMKLKNYLFRWVIICDY